MIWCHGTPRTEQELGGWVLPPSETGATPNDYVQVDHPLYSLDLVSVFWANDEEHGRNSRFFAFTMGDNLIYQVEPEGELYPDQPDQPRFRRCRRAKVLWRLWPP